MEACTEKTEVYLERKEPTPVEMAGVAVHPKVPNEEAEVETVGPLEDRYGDWHAAVGRHQQLKKWTQGYRRSQKKLATVCRQVICQAVTAQHKERCHKGLTVERR
jgi:hypothetical protein